MCRGFRVAEVKPFVGYDGMLAACLSPGNTGAGDRRDTPSERMVESEGEGRGGPGYEHRMLAQSNGHRWRW